MSKEREIPKELKDYVDSKNNVFVFEDINGKILILKACNVRKLADNIFQVVAK